LPPGLIASYCFTTNAMSTPAMSIPVLCADLYNAAFFTRAFSASLLRSWFAFYQLFVFQTAHRKWDAVSSKRGNFDDVQFSRHSAHHFGTHNLQTFKHNILVNEFLLMQFYLFNIRPKLHHQKRRVPLLVNKKVERCMRYFQYAV